ncbi:MAG: hypothetical protein ACXACI_18930 [Candidatus Hodarchaeales archaeon]|jgi:hypothetical protein
MDKEKALFVLSVDKGQNLLDDFSVLRSMAEQFLTREISPDEFDAPQIWKELREQIPVEVITQAKAEIAK